MNATLPGSSLKDFSRLLSCFAKIGDDIALEVAPGKLLLSTLNSSKSAFVLVTLNATRFERFEYVPLNTSRSTKQTQGLRCRIQLRALLAIFKPRNIDSKESRDAAVEKCELKLLHPSSDATDCQLLIRLVCKHGVRKTYKLQYEETQTMHAITDRTICHNRFKITARALKDVMDHFAPRAEELTLAVNDGNLLLTSFTEGVMSDREVLKQPIHTSITIDSREFDSMDVDEELLITFALREFKALGLLCDALGTDMSVCYSEAGKPLLVDFEKDGMLGEFVVATTGDGERADRGTHAISRSRPDTRGDYQPRTISRHESEDRDMTSTYSQRPIADLHEDHTFQYQDSANPFDRTLTEKAQPQGSALFAPDPDIEDDSVQAEMARFRQQNIESGRRLADGHEADVEDEMQLYADEAFAEDEDMELGPTQNQNFPKAKGLFD